jgi:hypothetical protein
MKSISLILSMAVTHSLLLIGCAENTSLPVPPSQQTPSLGSGATLAKGAVARSVTGQGNIWIEGKMGVMTITGRLYADQSVDGILEMVTVAWLPSAKMHGRVVALTFYDTYSFSNGVSGPTALFWWQESKMEGYKGKFYVMFVVDNGQGKNDWVGSNDGPYDAVDLSITPQVIASKYPDFFVPLDVGNVTIR